MTDEKGRPMTYWGGKPESETPLIKRLNVAADVRDMRGENAISALLREAATALSLAQTEIKGHMRVEDELKASLEAYTVVINLLFERLPGCQAMGDLPGCVDELKVRIAELEKACGDMVDWLDSKEVKDTFEQSAVLTLTHPHLGIKIEPQFSRWAGEVIQRFREALKSRA